MPEGENVHNPAQSAGQNGRINQPEGLNYQLIHKFNILLNLLKMSYYQILYHIVFGTKYRNNTISPQHSEELYKYIWGILKNKGCTLYRINGIENHIHLLVSLHPSVALSDLMKTIKVSSSVWMKQSSFFPDFIGWQDGYAAFTCTHREKEIIIQYIKNQQSHQQNESFLDEYKRLLVENQIDFDEKYLP